MKTDVIKGHQPRDPDKSCYDGDSIYLTGSFENALFRLMHIDACEVIYLDLDRLKASGFLDTLKKELKRHLEPKLTEKSMEIHKDLGIKARTYLDYYLPQELTITFEKEVFDRYERPLVSVTTRDGKILWNLKMVEAGKAFPYFIYPNAISLTDEGEFDYDTIALYRDAALKTEENGKGVWEYADTILLPMEMRFLQSRERPFKYCADLEKDLLHSPQHYFEVPIPNRLFFYPKDAFTAVYMEFRPTPDCPYWLQKAWRTMQSEPGDREEKERRERQKDKRKEKIKKRKK